MNPYDYEAPEQMYTGEDMDALAAERDRYAEDRERLLAVAKIAAEHLDQLGATETLVTKAVVWMLKKEIAEVEKP